MTLRNLCHLIVLTASLGGCTRTAPVHIGLAEDAIHVEQEKRVLLLQSLRGAERYRLRDFIASASRGRRDALHLEVSGSPRLGAQVAHEARAMGVAPDNVRLFGPRIDQPSDFAVRIEAIMYEAQPPVCPSLSIVGPAVDDNSFDPTIGCSIRNNLAAMVNDPRDLLDNRAVVATNGDRAAIPLATYGTSEPRNKRNLEDGTNNRVAPQAPAGGTNDAQSPR
ncbi:pilus assembly protein CpaD [Bradyrhizobium macuxiense]|uniref:Pilus assembly protein CpaD n=1 Tax=Bradyrhizobium macuxiense TaxID=1755647 RepID=A0A560LCD3_9BRAD|nr:CpaD family pilus assembly lipoprotein [Bradyrhizobium macuxiense]TWB93022.1 pilus assembly protein CpaD [Bradyrhizobium macuxiense]